MSRLVLNPASGHSGDYVTIDPGASIANVSALLGDNVTIGTANTCFSDPNTLRPVEIKLDADAVVNADQLLWGTDIELGDGSLIDVDNEIELSDVLMLDDSEIAVKHRIRYSDITFGSGGTLTIEDGIGSVPGLDDADLTFGANGMLAVNDDVYDSAINMGGGANVDIDGDYDGNGKSFTTTYSGDVDITGDMYDVEVTLGAVSLGIGETATAMNVGSVGDSSPTTEVWTLHGHVNVTIDDGLGSGDFTADALTTIHLKGNSSMTVDGDCEGGTWLLEDSSTFTGSTVSHGTWTFEDSSSLDMNLFGPDELTVIGTTVEASSVFNSSNPMDVSVRNGGEVEAAGQIDLKGIAEFEGDQESTLTYQGTGNKLTAPLLGIGAEIIGLGVRCLHMAVGLHVSREG